VRLSEILNGIQDLKAKGNIDIDIKNISCNSKKVTQDTLFVAIKGYDVDGHDYINDAIANGATAIMLEDINKINEEIQFVFKKLFTDYIKSNLSFGCCSHYIECSDNLKCINPDIKLKLGCQYKTNLDNKRIFYGKNSVIK